ncbi:MAG TPA: TRAP transporter substrate-binding protein [Chloroflexota bacterium]
MTFSRRTSRTVVFLFMSAALALVVALAGCQSAAPAAAPAPASGGSGSQPAASGSGQPAAAEQQQLDFKAGGTDPVTSPIIVMWQKYAQTIKEKTNGKINISFFPAGQLGGEREMVEGLQLGTVGMVVTSTTGYPIYDVLWIPYTFRDLDHEWKVMRGPIGQSWSDQFIKDRGIRVMGYAYRSPRNLTTSKIQVTKAADMKGMKIRVPESPGIVAGMKALGANPTPMAWPEVFTALQQGTVDGQENPMETIASNKLWEVQKNLSLTEHIRIPWLNLVDERLWQKITPANQKLMTDTWNQMADDLQKEVIAKENDYVQQCKTNGMAVVEKPDKQSFIDGVKDVYKDIAPKAWGDGVWEKVQATK